MMRYCCIFLAVSFMSVFSSFADGIQVITEHSPPGEYLDEETGRVTGPTTEMVRELMHRLNVAGDIAHKSTSVEVFTKACSNIL